MKGKIGVILFLVVMLVVACRNDLNEMDPQLIGTWTDTNSEYTFYDGDTLRYGIKYLRIGVIPDTIYNDSSYGTLLIDMKRHNITFNLQGYVTKDTIPVDTMLNSTTWNYEITDDTLLHYESNTMLGTLVKIR